MWLITGRVGPVINRHISTIVRAPKWGWPNFHPDNVLGTVAELLSPVGSHVKEDETMAVIETDKIAAEVKAPHSGIVRAIHVNLDDTIENEARMFTLERLDVVRDGPARQWAIDFKERKEREAREAAENWQRFQRDWQHEERRRWQDLQRRQTQGWWRRQQADGQRYSQQKRYSQQQQQEQQEQQQQQQKRSRDAASSRAEVLPEGDVKSMLLAKTHYDALRVSRTCSIADVKKAFRVLALRLHPDTQCADPGAHARGARPAEVEERARALHEAFMRLQEAYATLSDGRRRREYDRDLGW